MKKSKEIYTNLLVGSKAGETSDFRVVQIIQKKIIGIENEKIVLIHANGDKDYPKLHPSAKEVTYPLYPNKVSPKVDACVRKAFRDTGLYSEEQTRSEPIKRDRSLYISGCRSQSLYRSEKRLWKILNTKQSYASIPTTE